MQNKIGPLKIQGFNQGIYNQSSTQKEALGTVRILDDGRVFAYAKAGTTALGVALLTQSAPVASTAMEEILSATQAWAVGDMNVTVTFGGAVTADQYKDGWLYTNKVAGLGYIYRIKGHAAGTADVVLNLYDPIRLATTASTGEWSAVQNLQNEVVVFPITTVTGVPAGVPLIPVTASYYFWNQVKGPCPVYTTGTIVQGALVVPDNAGTAGYIEAAVFATSFDIPVGVCWKVNATGEVSLINLAIPGY
jgi:hypothetical protein